MTNDYNSAKEFAASFSGWIFTQEHKMNVMLFLAVKYSALNSVIAV